MSTTTKGAAAKKATTKGAAAKKSAPAEEAPKNGAAKAAEPKVKPDAAGKVEGVLLSAVKPEVVAENLAKFKLTAEGDLSEQVARLAVYFRANTPKDELGDCNTCKGDSDLREEVCPACPYCGESGVVDAPPVAAAPKQAEKEPPKAEVKPAPEKATHPVAEAERQAQKANGAGKPEQALASAPQKGATPAPAGKTFTVADLDAALADVEKAKQGEVGSYWDLGAAIHRIYANKLYLQRRAKGKADAPLYETWGQFCEAELGMTGTNAYRVMDVAANYDRATAIRVGVKKLNALLRIEDVAKRTKLLEGAEKIPVADFEAKVTAVVEKEQAGKTADRGRLTEKQKERNTKGSEAKAQKGTEAKAANVATPAAAPGAVKITAALALGSVKVKLFAKGEKITDPEAKRAKRLADGPFGVEETVNGVTSRYTITTDAKGLLVLNIERKRVGA